jgi:hypothetical protein
MMILKRESARGPHYSIREVPAEKTFFDFILLNEKSSQTIVKSKISNHLVVPTENDSKNKFKESILIL